MDAFREWWAGVVRAALDITARLWDRFVYNVIEGWDIRYFIFAASAVVILGAFMLMRRKA